MPEEHKPLTPEQRKTAAELPWYRQWLIASGRSEAEIDRDADR